MAETNVYTKLLAVQEDLKAPKNKFNLFGKYYYRNLESIFEGLKPCLKKYNASIYVSDEIVLIEGRFYIKATATFVDLDTKETVSGYGYAREADSKSGMDASQITGASSSYARKYALNGLLLIDDTADADSNEQAEEIKNKTEKKEKTPSQADMKKTEKEYISEAKVKALMKQCEHDGVNPALVCEKCHVPDFSKLTEKQFSWLHGKWKEVFVNGN